MTAATDPATLIAALSGRENSESLERSAAASFPLDALPPLLADVVKPAADTFGLPADFYALPLLASVAGAVGDAAELELRPGQRERAIVWLAMIGGPGAGKSPALDLARQPLDRLQEAMWRDWLDRRDAWEALPREQRPTARPALEGIVTGDATVEAVGAMLRHTRGLVVMRDELSGWALSMDAYKARGGADRAAWLSLWAGGAVKIDRKGDDPIFIARPCVSLVGGLTPDALPALQGGARLNDGLLDRLLPAWPATRVPRWNEARFPDGPLDRVTAALATLRAHLPAEPPATVIRLSPAARRIWIAWHDDNAERVERGMGLGAGFAAKLPRHVPRLALVLHAASDPDALARPLDEETMEAAIELGECFRAEHGRMLAAIGAGAATEPAGLPGRVLRYLRRAGGEWVSRTELLDRLRNVPAHRLREAITELEGAGLAACRTVPTATKPREEVRLRSHPFEGFGEFGESGDGARETPNNPNPSNGGDARGIWTCARCGLPRSGDDRPCPGCGNEGGRWFVPNDRSGAEGV